MANTIKLGNGTWATKEGSLLAYNDENNNFKPLPFTTTRASSATVVNKQGLIETVGSGIPRIDFSDDANGALLLENSATNLIAYSEDFSNASWSKGGTSVVSGVSSPDGATNAFKLVENATTGVHSVYRATPTLGAVDYSYSVFAKASGNTTFRIQVYDGTHFRYALFNLNTGVAYNETLLNSSDIKLFANGYYKCSINFTASAGVGFSYIQLIDGSNNISYTGDGTSGVYIYGAQLEQGSYATSYIKTVGTTQTRVADTATGSGSSTVINSSEGVLYAEISALANDTVTKTISLSDGSSNNKIELFYFGGVAIYTNVFVGGVSQGFLSKSIDITNYIKVAYSYKLNNTALWVNGVKVATDNSVNMPIALSELNFDNGTGSNPFYGKTKSVQVYTTALSDAELTSLTTI